MSFFFLAHPVFGENLLILLTVLLTMYNLRAR